MCNATADGQRGHADHVPVGLRELYSRLRGLQATLRATKKQAGGTFVERKTAVENIGHALSTLDSLLLDLERYGVPS
jgi:hypothetical protein